MCYSESMFFDFNPRSPCGERPQGQRRVVSQIFDISIHAPRVGSDTNAVTENPFEYISIHAPRVGSDYPGRRYHQRVEFQSTLPVWGATGADLVSGLWNGIFQSTLPVWGATVKVDGVHFNQDISIHAPRVGSDLVKALKLLV